nr:hypothetical protein [Tanacetum cinerariifolium]
MTTWQCFSENFKKIQLELVPPTPDAKEDLSDATNDGEHMYIIGHPDENEGPNEKEDPLDAANDGEHMDVEDPSDVAIYGEHMNTIGSPDETEESNAHEPISHVLNTPVDNGDVLMIDAPDTINLADLPSHESEITSSSGLEKKETDYIEQKLISITEYRKGGGMLSTANNGEVMNEPQLLDSYEINKKKGTLLQDFLPVIGNDEKEIKLKPWTEDLTRDSKATKTRIHVSKEVLDFFNQVQKPVIIFLGVYIPLSIKNAHWLLAEFQIRMGVVTFYDTLSGLESWQKENLDW